jgi:hypothetical protein
MTITLGPSDYFLPLIMTEIFDIRNFLSSDILFVWIEFIFGDLWIERFPKTDWGADLKFWKLSFEFKRGFKEEKKMKARAVQMRALRYAPQCPKLIIIIRKIHDLKRCGLWTLNKQASNLNFSRAPEYQLSIRSTNYNHRLAGMLCIVIGWSWCSQEPQ